jgi:hypothetical protein
MRAGQLPRGAAPARAERTGDGALAYTCYAMRTERSSVSAAARIAMLAQ